MTEYKTSYNLIVINQTILSICVIAGSFNDVATSWAHKLELSLIRRSILDDTEFRALAIISLLPCRNASLRKVTLLNIERGLKSHSKHILTP